MRAVVYVMTFGTIITGEDGEITMLEGSPVVTSRTWILDEENGSWEWVPGVSSGAAYRIRPDGTFEVFGGLNITAHRRSNPDDFLDFWNTQYVHTIGVIVD